MKKLNKKTFTENSLEAYAVCCANYSCDCRSACVGPSGSNVTASAQDNISYSENQRLRVTPYA